MTLIPFSAADLDALALRFVDLAAEMRGLARRSRERALEAVPLHGTKVQEWLARIESWALDARARGEAELQRQQGSHRARDFLAATKRRRPTKKATTRKK